MKGFQGQPLAHPQSHTFVGAINFDSLLSGQGQLGSTNGRSQLPGSPFSPLSSPAASAPPQLASSAPGSQPVPQAAGPGLHMTRKASGNGSGELPPLGPHISRRRATTRPGELPHAVWPASPLSRKGSAASSQELAPAALGLPANPAGVQASPLAQADAPQTVWGQVDRQGRQWQRGQSGGTVMCVRVEVCLPGGLPIRAAAAVFVPKRMTGVLLGELGPWSHVDEQARCLGCRWHVMHWVMRGCTRPPKITYSWLLFELQMSQAAPEGCQLQLQKPLSPSQAGQTWSTPSHWRQARGHRCNGQPGQPQRQRPLQVGPATMWLEVARGCNEPRSAYLQLAMSQIGGLK